MFSLHLDSEEAVCYTVAQTGSKLLFCCFVKIGLIANIHIHQITLNGTLQRMGVFVEPTFLNLLKCSLTSLYQIQV